MSHFDNCKGRSTLLQGTKDVCCPASSRVVFFLLSLPSVRQDGPKLESQTAMMPRCPLHWVLVLVTLVVVATLYMLHYPSSQPRYYLPYSGSALEKALQGDQPQPLLDDIFNATLGVSCTPQHTR
jgi:hypothetical protein